MNLRLDFEAKRWYSANMPMSTQRERFAWCLYDFANSGFPTVIVTAVYVLYFKNIVVGGNDPGYSDKLWGVANSIGAAVVFLVAPFLGAVADLSGQKRSFWFGFAMLCVVSTAVLSLTGPGTVLLAMCAFILALVGFEGSCVFYNAFLPDLVPPHQMEKLSGSAWALGYFGGLGCLLLSMPLALRDGCLPWVPLVVAGWFLVFSIPSFLMIRDRHRSRNPGGVISESFTRLRGTITGISSHRNLARFLMAYFFYNNAVVTIIIFAVAFSSDTLGFTTAENILLVVVMNLIAAPGAFAFGHVAYRIGSRQTIIITLVLWLLVVAGAQAAAWKALGDMQGAKHLFWGVAALASLCIGAIQATSRTLVGQLAPSGQSGEFFGFMAFAGKGSAILGPLVFGLVSDASGSQRLAVLTTGLFFGVGLILMRFVHVPPLNTSSPGPQ